MPSFYCKSGLDFHRRTLSTKICRILLSRLCNSHYSHSVPPWLKLLLLRTNGPMLMCQSKCLWNVLNDWPRSTSSKPTRRPSKVYHCLDFKPVIIVRVDGSALQRWELLLSFGDYGKYVWLTGTPPPMSEPRYYVSKNWKCSSYICGFGVKVKLQP